MTMARQGFIAAMKAPKGNGAIAFAAVLAWALPVACVVANASAHGIDGINGSWSPDGKRIAFQRENSDRRFEIGVLDVESGAIEWVVRDATGTAVDPAFGPDGTLVYAYYPMTNTSYVSYKAKSNEGLNLYALKNGATRRLTHGRWQDFTPSFGGDGALYYASNERGARPKYERGGHSEIMRLDLSGGGRATCVVDAPHTVASGTASPAVSPDGRFIAWAERCDFFDSWKLYAAPLEDVARRRPMTDYAFTAASPAWSPDGRHLFYQAFREGDAGWGIWVQDVATGAAKRLCDGEHPDVSPDGKWLLYDDTRRLYVRRLPEDAYDFSGCAAAADAWERAGTVHFTVEAEFDGDVSKGRPLCWMGMLSASVSKGGGILVRDYFDYDSAVSCLIFSDYRLAKGRPETVRVTGVIDADSGVWAIVNGSHHRLRIPIDKVKPVPPKMRVKLADGVRLVSSGAGWPKDVKKPISRQEMAK